MNQKIIDLKHSLQITLNQKSIKIYKNGEIQVTYRFKPKEFLVDQSLQNLENNLLKQLKIITKIGYRITKMQKEPTLCYKTYVELLNLSTASSRDKIKQFLKYFEKQGNGNFKKTSYRYIILTLIPIDIKQFNLFLNS